MKSNYILVKKIGILFIFLLSLACKEAEKSKTLAENPEGKEIAIEYANGFSITEFKDYSIIEVNSPWPEAEKSFKYLLAKKEAKIPKNVTYDQKVTIPVQKMVVTSTTHIPALEALNETSTLKGFPGLDYISSEQTRNLIDSGAIKEVGKNESLNTEVLIDLQPDVVIGFAINADNKSFSTIQKTGIPVVYNGEWTESSALGKAEWIKFFGALYDKSKAADSIFQRRARIRHDGSHAPQRPRRRTQQAHGGGPAGGGLGTFRDISVDTSRQQQQQEDEVRTFS